MSDIAISETELTAHVDAELAKQRAATAAEIVRKKRVEADLAHNRRINARHPIEANITPQEVARRNAIADESLRQQREKLAANERRWAEQEAALAKTRQPGPRMRSPGSEGLRIKA